MSRGKYISHWKPEPHEAFHMHTENIIRPSAWPDWLKGPTEDGFVVPVLAGCALKVLTPIGAMFCEIGDWMVRDKVAGDVYPCKGQFLKDTVKELA